MPNPFVILPLGMVAGAALQSFTSRFHKPKHNQAKAQPASAVSRAKFVGKPHPHWHPGQPLPSPYSSDNWDTIDPDTYDKASMYTFMISAVVPRPIAFVSSLSASGKGNLAPYSYFNAMGHSPPTICIGINRSATKGNKDTLTNILETREFVVNIISDWFIEAANHTAGEFDLGVNEMEVSGLTPLPSVKVSPPRVKESAVHMECVLRQVVDVPDKSGAPSMSIVIGEIVMVHVNHGVVGRSPTGKLVVDPIALQPVCRLGGLTYGRVTELYDITRPNKDGIYPPLPNSHRDAPINASG